MIFTVKIWDASLWKRSRLVYIHEMNQPWWDPELTLKRANVPSLSQEKKKISQFKQVKRCWYAFCMQMKKNAVVPQIIKLAVALEWAMQLVLFLLLHIRLALGLTLTERKQTNSLPSIHYYAQRVFCRPDAKTCPNLVSTEDIFQPLEKQQWSPPGTQGGHVPFNYS